MSGCPDNITITCNVSETSDFTAVVDVGENTEITLNRSQFVSTSDAGQTIINCIATNAVGNSTVVAVSVKYGKCLLPICMLMLVLNYYLQA